MSSSPDVLVPDGFGGHVERGSAWRAWVHALPRLVRDVLGEWNLTVDGGSASGETALVIRVRTDMGEPAVVKFGWPHVEGEHEHLALRAWAGDGAVRLLRADPHRTVLLLERAQRRDLNSIEVAGACRAVADLYPRLHRAAVPQLRKLSGNAARWSAELSTLPASFPAPRRLVLRAAGLAADFAADPATDGTLIHTDLHYSNVLAAARQPWLAIDPKPLSGDPAFEIAPLLWNRWPEIVAGGDARAAVRRRVDVTLDRCGFAQDRVRDWILVRSLVNVKWAIAEAGADAEWITRNLTIAKAVLA